MVEAYHVMEEKLHYSMADQSTLENSIKDLKVSEEPLQRKYMYHLCGILLWVYGFQAVATANESGYGLTDRAEQHSLIQSPRVIQADLRKKEREVKGAQKEISDLQTQVSTLFTYSSG